MVKMISKTAHLYGTRRLQAGDEFEVRGESDARLLLALRRAERAPKIVEKPAPAPRARKPRVVEPAAPVVVEHAASPYDGQPIIPFERTTPLTPSEVVEPEAPVAPKRPRLTLRRVVDSFGPKDE